MDIKIQKLSGCKGLGYYWNIYGPETNHKGRRIIAWRIFSENEPEVLAYNNGNYLIVSSFLTPINALNNALKEIFVYYINQESKEYTINDNHPVDFDCDFEWYGEPKFKKNNMCELFNAETAKWQEVQCMSDMEQFIDKYFTLMWSV